MAPFDAVFVGSGINSLAGAALLARRRLARLRARAGGPARRLHPHRPTISRSPASRTRCSRRGIRCSPARGAYAELKDELDRRGVEYVNTDLPTGTAFPDGSAAFVSTARSRETSPSSTALAAGDGAAWERAFDGFMANADLAFGLLGTELWSSAGLALGRTALPPPRAGAGCSSSPAARSSLPRLGDRRRSAPRRRTGCSRRGCCTRGSGRIRRPRAS